MPETLTEATATVEVPAVSTPAAGMARLPPVSPRFEVTRAVAFVPLPIVSVPPHRRAFVAIVNVDALAGRKDTLPPNSCATAPKLIVGEAVELNVTDVTRFHDPDVLRFVHEPFTVHEPPVAVRYAVAAAMLTFPVIATVDVVAVMKPVPLTVNPPAVTVRPLPDVIRLPLTVNVDAVYSAVSCVIVPLTVSAKNPFDAFRRETFLDAPLRVTVPALAVNVDPAPLVFQLPETVQAPLVVIVPDSPPVIVTLPVPTVTAELPA